MNYLNAKQVEWNFIWHRMIIWHIQESQKKKKIKIAKQKMALDSKLTAVSQSDIHFFLWIEIKRVLGESVFS